MVELMEDMRAALHEAEARAETARRSEQRWKLAAFSVTVAVGVPPLLDLFGLI